MARPLIAIPARFSASASALRYAAEVSARQLIEGVYAAGGEPLVMHPDGSDVTDRLGWADGVLLPGGGDLSGRWSGQGSHPTLYDVDEEQDAFDLAVASFALSQGIPLLSICRGTQVVNVGRGGTLIQDMDSHDSQIKHHRHHVHDVTVEESRLRGIVGQGVEVSCYHHQCIDRLGEDLVVTARSEEGVIEAVEMPSAPGFYVGVQWHPEDTWRTDAKQLALFEALVAAAR
ncbi:MAG: gamma-glutamyl-gamma-aminobutyrate hydrolase family protein [Candidatus Nanopelagicales bacterium]